MADPIKRVETSTICETERHAYGTVQWFAENRNTKGSATHPITHNNHLHFFICGEEAFADIADQITQAKESIDLICWGFDPGMELVRTGTSWPRGPTFGDLLIDAARRGVQVRLLVWWDLGTAHLAKNMPGYSDGAAPWRNIGEWDYPVEALSARNSVALRQAAHIGTITTADRARIVAEARAEYCVHWFKTVGSGKLQRNIEFTTRSSDSKAIERSLSSETRQPDRLTDSGVEGKGLVLAGTHHQKTILIDYRHDYGRKAVAYVMGLNSVTDYWCTTAHHLDDPRREAGGKTTASESVQKLSKEGKLVHNDDAGFRNLKPYQDYACRIEQGGALMCVYQNFVKAWDRARKNGSDAARYCTGGTFLPCTNPPVSTQAPAEPHHSTVQIVRTQPEEGPDHSIKEVYFQATDIAALGAGYIYLENQYFQYQDWSERLVEKRAATIAAWNRAVAKSGKAIEDMPLLYVFIVIPVPERTQMVPRTYDTLAVLGQQDGMVGQSRLVKDANDNPAHACYVDEWGRSTEVAVAPPKVVQHANTISKPDIARLESSFGLKVATAMLQTSGVDQGRWRYREIYIHSKLFLVSDSFLTLGSANLNQRSMVGDSELNLATNDPRHATALRKRIFSMQTGGETDGEDGSPHAIASAYKKWIRTMNANRLNKSRGTGMEGFLLPIEDGRSSTIRLA